MDLVALPPGPYAVGLEFQVAFLGLLRGGCHLLGKLQFTMGPWDTSAVR
jgi:hypothetical protein